MLWLWLQTPFDHVYQTTPDVLRLCVVEAAQGTVDQEHRQAVYRRPGQELGAQTPLGGQDAALDEPSRAAPKSWKGVRPPSPALAGLAALRRLSDAEKAVRNSPGSAWANRR